MGVSVHVKTDSETSIEVSTPPRSPRRALYYVQSPSHSQNDVEKLSYGWPSPYGSPNHHSPCHHSRESSTSRFSASLKIERISGGGRGGWRRMQRKYEDVGTEEEEEEEGEEGENEGNDSGQLKFYVVCFLFSFMLLFTIFSLSLWAASLSYKPRIIVKSISFENFYLQAGNDATGVQTDMLTLNSTIRISYRNPATFFGVHVSSTPLELHYLDIKVASGHIKKFYQSRKSERKLIVVVEGKQVPLYGGILLFSSDNGHTESVSVPLNLTFVMRSRAFVLGRLVKPKFYRSILCEVTLRGDHLGKPVNLTKYESCVYH